jgi:hypothetical protein
MDNLKGVFALFCLLVALVSLAYFVYFWGQVFLCILARVPACPL